MPKRRVSVRKSKSFRRKDHDRKYPSSLPDRDAKGRFKKTKKKKKGTTKKRTQTTLF